MIVCHCLGLSDRDLRDAARSGGLARNGCISGTTAASACGGCRELVLEILADSTPPHASGVAEPAPLSKSSA